MAEEERYFELARLWCAGLAAFLVLGYFHHEIATTNIELEERGVMERIPIAELAPSLPSPDTKVIKAVVTLLWPYSSSTRQCALLLADPDFRLRRRRGQVRVRFSGPAGRALGNSGIGIGDEVILSLQGAHYIDDVGDVRTPGKSVEWELLFQQRLVAQISRDEQELARLDIDHPTPSPEPASPVTGRAGAELHTITPVAEHGSAQSTPQQWSSPAFLKRTRVSDGSSFDSGYDPLSFMEDSINIFEANGRKRRRKSYKDWGVWTYSKRTPSPEKEGARSTEEEEESSISPDERVVSPSAKLLEPPLSAPKDSTVHSVALDKQELLQNNSDIEMTTFIKEMAPIDESAKEVPSPLERFIVYESEFHSEIAEKVSAEEEPFPEPEIYQPYLEIENFEGDTQPNTEDDEAEIREMDADRLSTTEIDSGEEGERPEQVEESTTESAPTPEEVIILSSTEEDSVNELVQVEGSGEGKEIDNYEIRQRDLSETQDDLIVPDQAPPIMMPPPHLPSLQTDFSSPTLFKVQTPIGNAPSTPVIHPLESSTLSLPSPFPGERDAVSTSYFGRSTSIQPTTQALAMNVGTEGSVGHMEQHTIESSMHSGMETPKMNARHGMHSTAFNEIRFPFGLDGSMFSREKAQPEGTVTMDISAEESVADGGHGSEVINETKLHSNLLKMHEERVQPEFAEQMPAEEIPAERNIDQESSAHSPLQQKGPVVIDLSSDQGSESTEDEEEENNGSEEEHDIEYRIEEAEDSEEDDARHRPRWIPPEERYMYDRSSPQNEESAESSNSSSQESEDDYSKQNDPLEVPSRPVISESGDGQEIRNVQEANAQVAMESLSPMPAEEYIQEEPMPEELSMEPLARRTSQRVTHIIDLGDGESDEDEVMTDQQTSMESLVAATDRHPSAVDKSAINQKEMPLEDHLKPHLELDPSHASLDNTHTTEDATETDLEDITVMPEEPVKRPMTPPENRLSPTIPAMNTRSKTLTSPAKEKETRRSLRPRSQTSTPNKSTEPPTESHGQDPTPHRPTPSPISNLSRTSSVDIDMSVFEPIDFPNGDTQGVSATQTSSSRFANVLFIKDSEDENLRSESSISTVQYSDGIETVTMETYDYSGQTEPITQTQVPNSLYPQLPPTSQDIQIIPRFDEDAPEVSAPNRAAATSESLHQSQHLSPERDFSAHEPQYTQVTNVADLSQDVSSTLLVEHSSKAGVFNETDAMQLDVLPTEVTYPQLPGALEAPSSPPTQLDSNQQDLSVNHQPVMRNNLPMTPAPSQQQILEPQESYQVAQAENALPLTPQLTQRTSTDLLPDLSFQSIMSPEAAPTAPSEEQRPLTEPRTEKARRQTLQSRLSTVPQKLSDWFAPRSSLAAASDPALSASSPEESASITSDSDSTNDGLVSPHANGYGLTPTKPTAAAAAAAPPLELPSQGLRTPLSYYAPLATLPAFLNRAPRAPDAALDVLALVTRAAAPVQRAEKGPHDYHTVFSVTDRSTFPAHTLVQVFRPWRRALPAAEPGDVVLLRSFVVRSAKGKVGLVSGEESAWCVWRFGMEIWGRRRGEFGELEARETVKGPPVERGREERMEVERLRGWWEDVVKMEVERGKGVVHESIEDGEEVGNSG
ncbi:hypothetical protein AOQ84DRAFT_443578 [Glonium stellatum]|uniref:Telomeric single stranded DNA binding POT1/Cdc13 domain-containing protein n=1 Tax=Glonium stellatum TaxID=574774 RepID=A0A8E2EP99_9PEZI|nr:hypothetical protein AOQ84DRAFT_443578 [Glonium stellatum]